MITKDSTVSIIIPMYNHYNLTHQCLFDLYKSHVQALEIIIVNDGSTDDEVSAGLSWWKKNIEYPVKVLNLEENLGFTGAVNRGVAVSSGDIVIILSNDVRVYADIATLVKAQLLSDDRQVVGAELLSRDTGWNTFDGVIYPYIYGYLMACTREVWDELGGMDEIYSPGDFEDVDFSTTAISKGMTLSVIEPTSVHHVGAGSYGYTEKRRERTVINQEKFKEKWGIA